MSDNSKDLADLLGTQESASLEFKRTAKREGKRGDAIGNAVCAMANDLCGHGGGDVLIGVDDKGHPVDDVALSDRALLQLTELRDDGRILDRPSLTVDRPSIGASLSSGSMSKPARLRPSGSRA
ncbi:helix-turn-helix domain-containing protein [Streptomyces sp. AGS-58]|uniref:AlbA family DNA-binding domain-containing protein n=1 Tax=unclassified Streptomyces TaxID=2593676 RepID=UPI0035A35677